MTILHLNEKIEEAVIYIYSSLNALDQDHLFVAVHCLVGFMTLTTHFSRYSELYSEFLLFHYTLQISVSFLMSILSQ